MVIVTPSLAGTRKMSFTKLGSSSSVKKLADAASGKRNLELNVIFSSVNQALLPFFIYSIRLPLFFHINHNVEGVRKALFLQFIEFNEAR